MAISLIIAYATRLSISVAVVAMTDVKSDNSEFKVGFFTVSRLN